jgi:competence protein ComEC
LAALSDCFFSGLLDAGENTGKGISVVPLANATMKRPLLIAGLLYVAGILIGNFVSVPLAILASISLAVTVTAIVWTAVRSYLLYAVVLLTAWTGYTFHTAINSPYDLRRVLGASPEIVTVRGVLSETPNIRYSQAGDKTLWHTMARINVTGLRPNRGEWKSATGRMAVTTPGELTNLFAGQTVEISGVAALPKFAAAEGLFDYRNYLRRLGIYYQLQTSGEPDWQVLKSPRKPLADRFRSWARNALAMGLPAEDESLRLEWALTLGWKTALTEEVSEPFVRAATYHIFAVDGLRMAIVFGICFGLFRAMGIPRSICGLILIPLIWFYVALTGWPASAIRATVMLTIIIIGWILKRPSDLINSLFAAALIILACDPQQLFQAGFQLSFFVVLCIILIVPPLHKYIEEFFAPDPLLPKQLHRKWPPIIRVPVRYVLDVLVTSFAAWVGAIPLVAYYFNIVTPVSTPANLLAVPLCAVVLISNLASLLLAPWFHAAAELFNHAGWFLMECIRVTSDWFADWPAAYYYVSAPTAFTTSLYYAIFLAVVTGWLFQPRLRALKFTVVTLSLLFWSWQHWESTRVTRLTVLTLNGGSAVYFDAPGKKTDLLVDCGSVNAVDFTTKPFLRAQGVNTLPSLLLTHGDIHHVGGAEVVANLFSVKHIYASSIHFRSPAYRNLIDTFSRRADWLRTLNRNNKIGDWAVLHPNPTDHFPQADDSSVVLLGEFGKARVLLLSDLGRPGQNALLERNPDLKADIVVTGLPVQTEPVCDALLDRLQPRVVIVSDSDFPVSERANAKLCERLARRNVPVLYTHSTGSATIEFRGNKWTVRTMSGAGLTSAN